VCGITARRSTSSSEAATPTMIPLRTPSTKTAASVTSASRKSEVRTRQSRRNAGTSINLSAVTRTTAPSALVGRLRKSGVRATRVTARSPAAKTPVTCVRPPLSATTKLRESLPFAGKPWNTPAKRFAPPSARNSRFERISSPSRAASACAVRTLLAKTSSAMLPAGNRRSRRLPPPMSGSAGPGMPPCTRPTTLIVSASPTVATKTVATTRATSPAGMNRANRVSNNTIAAVAPPTTRAHGSTVSALRTNPPRTDGYLLSVAIPVTFGSWLIAITIPDPAR
jgi:hypothetical protein